MSLVTEPTDRELDDRLLDAARYLPIGAVGQLARDRARCRVSNWSLVVIRPWLCVMGLVAIGALAVSACAAQSAQGPQSGPATASTVTSDGSGPSLPITTERSVTSVAADFSLDLLIELQGTGNFVVDETTTCAGTGSYAGFREGGVVQVIGDDGAALTTATIESLDSHALDVGRMALGPFAQADEVERFADIFMAELTARPDRGCLMWLTIEGLPDQASYQLQLDDHLYDIPGPGQGEVELGRHRQELPWSVGCPEEPECASMWSSLGILRPLS